VRVSANILFALCLVSPLLFAATLWLSRAGPQRSIAAVAGCIAATVFSLAWDALAARLGWWSYPHHGDILATLALSATIAFLFGGVAGLIGWRMMRAMGWTGAATFFIGFVGIGLMRDHTLEVNTTAFYFGEGPMPQVMAAVGYLSMSLIVQITMLIMVGPPTRDELRGIDAN
jgi:hypothetical protein